MMDATVHAHGLRRTTNHGTRYPPVEREPEVKAQHVATTSPIVHPRSDGKCLRADAVTAGLRDHSAYSDALVELVSRIAADVEPEPADVSSSLQARIDSWCVLHGYDPDEKETLVILTQQAVFALLLKATLYEWHHQRGTVPALTDDVREAFQLAHERVDSSAFEECVLDELVWSAENIDMREIVAVRNQLLKSTQPAEDIGQLYQTLISGDQRQVLGQIRTPPEIRRLMRGWTTSGSEIVLDPGMGAAGLSAPFHPDWVVSTDPRRVDGIDRSPLARLMGTTALTLARQAHEPLVTDFLDLTPEDLPGEVDAIICNPPYTRDQHLPGDYKEAINTQIERETELDVSLRSPLYAYFMYHSREFLAPGDRASFITPQSFLAANYGESLKHFLLQHFDVKALVLFDPTAEPVFDEALTTSLITFLEATENEETTGCTRFIRIDEKPDMQTLREAVRDGQQGSTNWGFINCVQQTELVPERNWQALFDPGDIDTNPLTPLGEFVTVHRGKTTGNTDFFCLSQDEIDEIGIDKQHLSRLVRRSNHIQGYDFREDDWEKARANGKEVWLLDPDELDAVPDSIDDFNAQNDAGSTAAVGSKSDNTDEVSNLLRYLRAGVTEHELQDIGAVKDRPLWYRPRRQESTRVLVRFASRDGFSFILNEADVRNTNNLYGFYDITLGETELKALLAYLNSDYVDTVVREYQRTLGGGFDKIEPNDLEDVPVPDPNRLPDDIVTTLATAFDELRETVRQGDDCDPVIDRIDAILQQEL